MSAIFIQKVTVRTKLTQYRKVRDQINTIEMLETKLKYGVKHRDQICSLPLNKSTTSILYIRGFPFLNWTFMWLKNTLINEG